MNRNKFSIINRYTFLLLITFYCFNSCKKGNEERIATYVGTWKYVGYYSYSMSQGMNRTYVNCATKSFIVKIGSNNTFITTDTLGTEIFKGTIKSVGNSLTWFHPTGPSLPRARRVPCSRGGSWRSASRGNGRRQPPTPSRRIAR